MLTPFYQADMARWPGTAGAGGYWAGGAPAKAQDMKNFLFTGWTDQFGADPAVPAGGRATHLRNISDNVAYNATTLDGDVGQLPAKPAATYTGAGTYPLDALTFTTSAFSDPQGSATFGAYQWRVGEITDVTAPAYDPAADRLYEIVDVWRSAEITDALSVNVQIPASVLRQGHAYRVRVRHKDATGRYSHWSDAAQFITGAPDSLALLAANLYISEIMYKPAPPTAAQAAAPNFWVENDFEYVELTNRSTLLTLDLTEVRFTKGVDFDFAGSAITSLAPGQSVLVVRNIAAFTSRYGAGLPIAGAWDAGQSLSNGGEQLKLSFGAGAAIHDIVYDDNAPWPADGDNGGISIVYTGPDVTTGTDPQTLAANWIASCIAGGTPGTEDFFTLARWMQVRGETDPYADANNDGWDNLSAFAFGRDIRPVTPTSVLTSDGGEQYLDFTYTRRLCPAGVSYVEEISTDLMTWSTVNVMASSAVNNNDGTETRTLRITAPRSAAARYFIHSRAVTQ